jgi:hypothetical protein
MKITGSVISVVLVPLPGILALTLLYLLVRFCFSSARTSPGLWVCGVQVALSAFLLVISWRTLPSPVISIIADIIPAVGSMVLLAVAAWRFKRSPLADRSA